MTIETKWNEVESSFINAFAWEPADSPADDPRGMGWCLIDIRGTVYTYLTPSWVYALLCSAKARGTSVGRVYSNVIRGKFARAV